MPTRPLPAELLRIFQKMEVFEASESVKSTGTGTRREGEQFEQLIATLWTAVTTDIQSDPRTKARLVSGQGTRRYLELSIGDRTAYFPCIAPATTSITSIARPSWLDVTFKVNDLVDSFPSRAEAVRRYSPATGPFAGSKYPEMYDGLSTKFDDTVVLVEGGVLREKILLEYKTAKSSKARQIDGNAHERLSFQVMQYLEVATRFTKCRLAVIANGAFAQYRNKYHVNFHVQADRLSNFAWFNMVHACTATEYATLIREVRDWLLYPEGSSSGRAS